MSDLFARALSAIIDESPKIRRNLGSAQLVEEAVRNGEGLLAAEGPFVVATGKYTGRSAQDKYIVRDSETESTVWWGKTNVAMSPEHFANLRADFLKALQGTDRLYVADLFGGSQPEHRVNVRVITELAWHSLFVRTLLVRPTAAELEGFSPEYTIIDLPSFRADPARHGCRSETIVAVNLSEKLILIGGTAYAGEMKKSVFGILNYLLPASGVMPMHSAANIGPKGDVAVFFGLSGTGKTTLSADPSRTLIGDDEHGWSDTGVFNFEGGCYAKTINLSPTAEPDIFATTHRFGTILENVVVIDSETRQIDLDDDSLADGEQPPRPTRSTTFPMSSAQHRRPTRQNMILLTADAFGVLPPIARLSPDQAMYHFLSGLHRARCRHGDWHHRADARPSPTCFGAPFIPLPSLSYGNLLAEKLTRHNAGAWLVNTGWTGSYGTGRRMPIRVTRALLNAALPGALDGVTSRIDPNFRFRCAGCRS